MIGVYFQVSGGNDELFIMLWKQLTIDLKIFEICDYSNLKSIPVE